MTGYSFVVKIKSCNKPDIVCSGNSFEDFTRVLESFEGMVIYG